MNAATIEEVWRDVRLYEARDSDAFWDAKKSAWYRRLSGNFATVEHLLADADADTIRDMLARNQISTAPAFETTYDRLMSGASAR